MKKFLAICTVQWALWSPLSSWAAMNHAGMSMDESGMIMNANPDKLPRDCNKIAEDVHITVHAGQKYARQFNGKMFAYDQQQWEVEPCTRIKFTFVNDDHVRHQLMIHGLPGYLYPKGMFTIEVNGNGQKEASLIVPTKPETYMVHCDISQHTAKGMKAQLKVAGGSQDLPGIPGLTEPVTPDWYPVEWTHYSWMILFLAVCCGFALPFFVFRVKAGANHPQQTESDGDK